jgi:hypothetical protein
MFEKSKLKEVKETKDIEARRQDAINCEKEIKEILDKYGLKLSIQSNIIFTE